MAKTTTPKTPAPAKRAAAKPTAAKTPAATAEPSAPGKIAKTELIDQVAAHSKLTKKESAEAVGAVLDVIVEALRAGHTVGLPGLGTLSVKATAARTGVRPGTSDKIQIPAGKKISYKVAADLKSSL